MNREKFESLGVWEGWEENIFPPYWEELRRYVFKRDGYRCSRCHKVFRDSKKVDCHHIVWKESGGSDNPRNLVTVCEPCHDAIHLGDGGLTDSESVEEIQPDTPDESTNRIVNGTKYQLSRGDEWEHTGDILPMIPGFSRKRCGVCKRRLVDATRNQKYCGDECAQEAKRRRAKQLLEDKWREYVRQFGARRRR